jgi:hypothetical protein
MGSDPNSSVAFNHFLHWGVAAIALYIAVVTIRRGEFKFPPPVPPIRRSDFPEGYWPLVGILFLLAGWLAWSALQP